MRFKIPKPRFSIPLTLALSLLAHSPLALAQSLTIQGKVTNASGQPIVGAGTKFRVQIITPDPANHCVIYDETHIVDLSISYGLFSINLGEVNPGRVSRDAPTNLTVEDAISNRAQIDVPGSFCSPLVSGTAHYVPTANDVRRISIQFLDPSTMGTAWETIPEMDLNPVAYAMDARAIGGYPANSILRVVGMSGAPAAFPSLTTAEATELQALAGGVSNKYQTKSPTAGIQLPTGAPSAAAAGSIWYSGGNLVYSDGTTTHTIGTSTGGTITGVTAGMGILGGGTTGNVSISLSTSGVTGAGTPIGSATTVPVLTYDTYGRITGATTAPISGTLPSAGAAGQILKSNGSSWASDSARTSDIKSTSDQGSIFPAVSCTASQTMYWDSPTDKFACQTIGLAAPSATVANSYKLVTVATDGRVNGGSSPTTLSGFGITDALSNANGVPTFAAGNTAGRPAAGSAGRLYVDTQALTLYRDNGSSWDTIGSAGAGGSLTGITAGTGLTGGGSAGNVPIGFDNTGITAGNYFKVTTNAQGRVLSGASSLLASDIPSLNWAAIGSGKPTTLSGYGISQAYVENASGALSIGAGNTASKPNFGTVGRIYVDTQASTVSYDTGSAWQVIASGAGFTGALGGEVSGTQAATQVDSINGISRATITANLNAVTNATDAATVSTLVKRDTNGDFAGRNISASELRLKDSATNTVKLKAASTSAAYSLQFPSTAPGAGESLQADAAGVLSWVTATAGTLTGVSASAPLISSGGNAPTISMPAASTSANGYLSSADWNIFNNKAPLASPAFTGAPTAPTAAVNNSSTQLATTAFVLGQAASTTPLMNGTAAAGVATNFSRGDHVHPSDSSRAPAAGAATINTVGTISTGTWQGSVVAVPYGGTGLSTGTAGGLPYFATSSTMASTAAGTTGQVLTSNGASPPTWAAPALSTTSVTAPIVNTGTASAPVIGITQASTSANGYLSSADWNSFSGKLGSALSSALIWVGNAGGVATAVAPSQDVSVNNAGAFTVKGLQSIPVAAAAPTSGNFFKYNGTNWAGANINLSDLKSSMTGALFSSPACTADKSLTWNSGSDQFSCQAIGSLNASAITAGVLPIANGGTGAASASQGFVFAGPATGGAGAPSFRALAATDIPATPSSWTASGSDVYRASGNVGIGTTSPGWPLDVQSGSSGINVTSTTGTNPARLQLINTAGTMLIGRESSAGGSLITPSLPYSGVINMQDAHSFHIGTSNVARLTVDASGNVGIGTTNPGAKLTSQADNATSLRLQTSGTGQYTEMHFAESGGADRISLTKAGNNDLQFWTATGTAGAEAWSQRAVIGAGGGLGIGVNTPSKPLDVRAGTGTAAWLMSLDNTNTIVSQLQTVRLRSDSTAPGSGFGGGIDFFLEGFTDGQITTAGAIRSFWENNQTDDTTSRNSSLALNVMKAGAGVTAITANSNGNVSIGTPTATAKLEVKGAIVSQETIVASGATADFSASNSVVLQAVGGTAITLSNMVAGGVYNLVIEDLTARTYTFSGCTTFYWSPANAVTANRSVFTIYKRGATSCYITWTTGFN